MLREKVRAEARARGLIRPGDFLVAGVSGGADSTALLLFLRDWQEEMGLTLRAVHVNHGLRGAASEGDQAFVEALCARLEVPLTVDRFDCQAAARDQGLTVEEAGRTRRSQAFARAARALEAEGASREKIRIVLAHHADDQAETILLRILRGTGPDGLAGMPWRRTDEEGFAVVRPFLGVSKAEILADLQARGQEHREDETNQDPSYRRNRVRLDLLPAMEAVNPRIREALIRLGQAAEEDRAYFEAAASEALTKVTRQASPAAPPASDAAVDVAPPASEALPAAFPDSVRLDGNQLRTVPRPVRIRLYRLALGRLGLREDLTRAHLDGLDSLLLQGGPSAEIDLPHGCRGQRIYEELVLRGPAGAGRPGGLSDSASPGERIGQSESVDQLEEDGLPGLSGFTVCLLDRAEAERRASSLPRGSWAAFDGDQVPAAGDLPLVCRTRRAGDFLRLPGGGRKKLQDYFVDRKVPRADRDRIRGIFRGAEALFLPADQAPGFSGAWSGGYPVKSETKKVLFIASAGAL